MPFKLSTSLILSAEIKNALSIPFILVLVAFTAATVGIYADCIRIRRYHQYKNQLPMKRYPPSFCFTYPDQISLPHLE